VLDVLFLPLGFVFDAAILSLAAIAGLAQSETEIDQLRESVR
jgi:hypothetical protein